MANDPSRTEKATPKRREKSREEGSVPRSMDFDSSMLLWGNYFLLLMTGGATMTLLGRQMALLFKAAKPGALTDVSLVAQQVGYNLAQILLPFLAANFIIALLVQLGQRGLHIYGKPLQPKFSRMNPVSGFGRLFSVRSVVELTKSLAKFLILAWVAYLVVAPKISTILGTMHVPLSQSLNLLRDTLFLLYRNVMLAMLALALADLFYQRFHFEKSIRMTKQEVKDEARDADQPPEIKNKLKSLMLSAAQRRMLAAVPKATVVITNPTHYAVALRYEPGESAPTCLAKGVDFMALRIRDKARAAGVTVVENPPLARALHASVRVDQSIPKELYQAVAQVLAFVYRLKGAA
jgi:flagellar biosynthetic protein FlhB